MLRYALPFTLLPLLASCAATPVAAPPTPRPPVATPAPAPAPAPAAVVDRHGGDWSVDEATTGEWRYANSGGTARASFFGPDGRLLAVIACGNGTISLGRTGAVPADTAVTMRLRNSFAMRDLSVHADHAARLIYTNLDANDPLWDQIAYSRGRFLIEASFQPPLIVPVRPEISRVIEDCRSR